MDMTAELTKRTEQIENIIKKYLPVLKSLNIFIYRNTFDILHICRNRNVIISLFIIIQAT